MIAEFLLVKTAVTGLQIFNSTYVWLNNMIDQNPESGQMNGQAI